MKAASENQTRTITFQPDPLSEQLLNKALSKMGRIRGMKTHLINTAIHSSLKEFAGKKDQLSASGK